jgi:uncharacterized protein (DUF433 family)
MSPSSPTSESTRGTLGQGLYGLGQLEAFVALEGKAGDGRRVSYWLTEVLNPVEHQPYRPDYSFSDLISLMVVRKLRERGVRPIDIREAELYLRERLKTDRPFVSDRIKTDGCDVFLDKEQITGQLESANKRGQQAMLDAVKDQLETVSYLSGRAVLWTPGPSVEVDPEVQFGEPVVSGTRVPTSVVARVSQDLGVEHTARRFAIDTAAAKAAVAFERRLAAALN